MPSLAPKTRNAHAGLLLSSLIVGFSFPAVGLISENLPPLSLTAIRFTIASVALWLLARPCAGKWPGWPGIGIHFVQGACLAGFFGTMFWAARHASAVSMASIFVSVPLTAYAMGRLAGVERGSIRLLSILLTGAVGALALVWADARSGTTQAGFGWAELAFLLACSGVALNSVLSKLGLERDWLSRHAELRAFWNLGCGSVLMAVAALIFEPWQSLKNASSLDALLLVYLALFSSALTFWLSQRATAALTPGAVTAYGYLSPFVSMLLLFLTDPHQIGWQWLPGSSLVVTAIAFLMQTQSTPTRRINMNRYAILKSIFIAMLAFTSTVEAADRQVGASPWGPEDEIGRLNLMNEKSRHRILSRVTGGKVYDLSVDYFIGMPSWQAAGDPHYRMWMTHTPHGSVVDDPLGVGREMNEHVSYTGSAVSMYTHTGTHIDALVHFGLDGKVWNGFTSGEFLGDRGWQRAGVENIPPIIARGVLIDVAASRGLDMLPDGYRVGREDLVQALEQQGVALQEGDVVLIRTGRMRVYDDAAEFMRNPPGLGLAAARFLAEEHGAMVIGADNLSFEAFPSELDSDYVPVHTYLLAEQGIPIIELAYLEDLARDHVYEFAFVGGPLKFRGADAAPIRPIALPVSQP